MLLQEGMRLIGTPTAHHLAKTRVLAAHRLRSGTGGSSVVPGRGWFPTSIWDSTLLSGVHICVHWILSWGQCCPKSACFFHLSIRWLPQACLPLSVLSDGCPEPACLPALSVRWLSQSLFVSTLCLSHSCLRVGLPPPSVCPPSDCPKPAHLIYLPVKWLPQSPLASSICL